METSERSERSRQKRKARGETERGRGDRKPRSAADYDKAISLIFCPSCRGSQEQLQWQGNIRSAVPLLQSPSRSITNDMEKQGRSCRARCPAHGAKEERGEWRGKQASLREWGDMLLASLVHQLLKGMRDKTSPPPPPHTHTHTSCCSLGGNNIVSHEVPAEVHIWHMWIRSSCLVVASIQIACWCVLEQDTDPISV